MSWGQVSGRTGDGILRGRFPTVAMHCLAYAHHSAQPRSRRGFLNLYLQLGHRRVVSDLKNSTRVPHAGQDTSKTSSAVQYRLSCPGHFMIRPPFSPDSLWFLNLDNRALHADLRGGERNTLARFLHRPTDQMD